MSITPRRCIVNDEPDCLSADRVKAEILLYISQRGKNPDMHTIWEFARKHGYNGPIDPVIDEAERLSLGNGNTRLGWERMKQHMVAYYLNHAEWPHPRTFPELCERFNFVGNYNVLVEEALQEVTKHLRMWQAFDDPNVRDELRKQLGEKAFLFEEDRKANFEVAFDAKEKASRSTVRRVIRRVAGMFRRGRV